ncbi:MAG TPA: hypothetical protein VL325_04690 [Pyrinomonadaceae bacterium]|jgi:hypothetical protein|nr:hypothetical protein [Pyrinomonadaceae bacterium]
MLYRPNFCCGCGERIERIDWKLWTSRRFCDLCATDHTLGEFIPKAIVGIGILIGIFGIGSFLQSRPAADNTVAKKSLFEQPVKPPPSGNVNKQATNIATGQSQPGSPSAVIADTNLNTTQNMQRAEGPGRASTEAVYYCGAPTKKGTACSRRVKTPNTRCWQHTGMPAMKVEGNSRG